MRPWITIAEPSEQDVKFAVTGATLMWLEEIVYGTDVDGFHYLKALATAEDFDSAPEELRLWYDKHVEKR